MSVECSLLLSCDHTHWLTHCHQIYTQKCERNKTGPLFVSPNIAINNPSRGFDSLWTWNFISVQGKHSSLLHETRLTQLSWRWRLTDLCRLCSLFFFPPQSLIVLYLLCWKGELWWWDWTQISQVDVTGSLPAAWLHPGKLVENSFVVATWWDFNLVTFHCPKGKQIHKSWCLRPTPSPVGSAFGPTGLGRVTVWSIAAGLRSACRRSEQAGNQLWSCVALQSSQQKNVGFFRSESTKCKKKQRLLLRFPTVNAKWCPTKLIPAFSLHQYVYHTLSLFWSCLALFF